MYISACPFQFVLKGVAIKNVKCFEKKLKMKIALHDLKIIKCNEKTNDLKKTLNYLKIAIN